MHIKTAINHSIEQQFHHISTRTPLHSITDQSHNVCLCLCTVYLFTACVRACMTACLNGAPMFHLKCKFRNWKSLVSASIPYQYIFIVLVDVFLFPLSISTRNSMESNGKAFEWNQQNKKKWSQHTQRAKAFSIDERRQSHPTITLNCTTSAESHSFVDWNRKRRKQQQQHRQHQQQTEKMRKMKTNEAEMMEGKKR